MKILNVKLLFITVCSTVLISAADKIDVYAKNESDGHKVIVSIKGLGSALIASRELPENSDVVKIGDLGPTEYVEYTFLGRVKNWAPQKIQGYEIYNVRSPGVLVTFYKSGMLPWLKGLSAYDEGQAQMLGAVSAPVQMSQAEFDKLALSVRNLYQVYQGIKFLLQNDLTNFPVEKFVDDHRVYLSRAFEDQRDMLNVRIEEALGRFVGSRNKQYLSDVFPLIQDKIRVLTEDVPQLKREYWTEIHEPYYLKAQ